jgi:cysteine-rich repeat protein
MRTLVWTLTCLLVGCELVAGIDDRAEMSSSSGSSSARCGDGIVDAGEACDDGNNEGSDACNPDCTEPRCGDGDLGVGEVCDDGNDVNGDACDENCTLPACGNGAVAPGERCYHEALSFPFFATTVELADLDGDGTAELLAGSPNGVDVYRYSTSENTFIPITSTTGPVGSITLAVRDFDGDGLLDFAAGGAGGLYVHRNAGTPLSFTTTGPFNQEYVGFAAAAPLRTGELPDIAILNGLHFEVLRNDGRMQFTPGPEMIAGEDAYGVVATDVDGDGDQDLAVVHAFLANKQLGNIVVFEGDGRGGLTLGDTISLLPLLGPNTIDAGDLDGDGDPELVIANHDSHDVGVFDNDGGTFSFDYSVGIGGISHCGVVRDIDGDGDLDVVAGIRDYGLVAILYNDAGRVGSGDDFDTYPIGHCPRTVAVGDVNGDGAPDIVASNAPDTFFCNPPGMGGLSVLLADP